MHHHLGAITMAAAGVSLPLRSTPPLPPATALRRTGGGRREAMVTATSNPGGKKEANLIARRKERIKLPAYESPFSISEFLAHPSGIEAVLNTRALHSFYPIDSNTYRCTLQRLKFFAFEVAPVLDLRVTPTDDDCTVEMLSCKFEGSKEVEQQNQYFSAYLINHLTWSENGTEPCLDSDVSLRITLEIYTLPLSLLPVSAVEDPGNLLIQGLIDRSLPLLVEQLLRDYRIWAEEQMKFSKFNS